MRLPAVLICVVLLTACGGGEMTAREAIDELTAAGLEAPNPTDVTAQECETTGCEEAIATDVVTIFRWQDSTQAAEHALTLKQPAYKLNEFVMAFPKDTDVDTDAYANALTEAVKGDDG